MISSAIWNKKARVKFQKANKLWSYNLLSYNYKLFIQKCMRKIMWLLIYNIKKKLRDSLSLCRSNAGKSHEVFRKSSKIIGILLVIFGNHWKSSNAIFVTHKVNFGDARKTVDDRRHLLEFLRISFGNLRNLHGISSFSVLHRVFWKLHFS